MKQFKIYQNIKNKNKNEWVLLHIENEKEYLAYIQFIKKLNPRIELGAVEKKEENTIFIGSNIKYE